MTTKHSWKRLVILLSLAGAPLGAQITETPVPFDSAGRIRSVTPALVTRFGLRAPAWPVTGEFTDARLFRSSDGNHVLSVERLDRSVERFGLTADNVAALRFAIDAAMTQTGRTVTEDPTEIVSQPARGSFVRNQMLLTWLVYGPSLAAMSNDGETGTALYLLATGASYFVTTGISRRMVVTRAQNHLATDGGVRGWLAAAGITYAFAGDDINDRTFAFTGLAGSLGGSILGFQRGSRLTDSEAQAAATVSNLAAVSALGVSGTLGAFANADDGRGPVAAMVAAGLLGYASGPEYPRRASYSITKGDIQVTELGAYLGAAIALTPFVRDNGDSEAAAVFATGTAGLIVGGIIAERQWARRYDHSAWDAGQTSLGTLAGVLMGSAATVLADPGVTAGYALVVGGATIGAILGHNLAGPAPAGSSRVGARGSRRISIDASPENFAFGALGVPGKHALLSIRF